MPEKTLQRLEWVIASVHNLIAAPMTVEQSTRMWLKIAENSHVDVIGHCADADYPFDCERVIAAFAKEGKIVEVNASKCRVGSKNESCWIKVARLCTKHRVPIVLSSDAHFAGDVGNVENAIRIVREAQVPEELILNADATRFAKN